MAGGGIPTFTATRKKVMERDREEHALVRDTHVF